MIKINPQIVDQINKATDLSDLFEMLQYAIELEHATIPPYLTALFSFKPGTEPAVRKIIYSVVIEEMMHMTIAANILNAIGGAPKINDKDFIPNYPGGLPMGIGNGLIVGLEKYSREVVKNVFMEIEEPENPLVFPTAAFAKAIPEFRTIGEFYMALQNSIDKLAPDKLPGDATKQVTSDFYAPDLLFPIITKADAIKAISIIIEQGEGTSTSPTVVNFGGEIAHYYRFEELYHGRQLVKNPIIPEGYSFTGAVIPFDPENVMPLFPNTKAAMLPPGSEERRMADSFNNSYNTLLNSLHITFNGKPDFLENAIGVMFDLRLTAQKLGATVFPGKPGFTIGPPYEYVPQ